MKIGLISGEFPPMPGGVGDFTRILAEHLLEQGHHAQVLSRAGSAHASLPVSAVAGWGLGGLRQVRAWARRRDFDVVNLQFQTAAYDMSPYIHFLPDIIGAPVITTFHDLRFPYLFPKAGPLRDWIVMRLARASQGVIATNREDQQSLRTASPCQMIPIGSNVKRRNLTAPERACYRRSLAADADCLLLGHFGFLRPIKGVDYLIDALARLRNAGKQVRLVFIGARSNTVDDGVDSGYLHDLDDRIRRRGLADAVHYTGYLPDEEASAWLGAVDIMALPYLDGASVRRGSLMAALHHGCAIITTEPAPAEPAFKHKSNLWLAPPHSSEAIENAVLQLMDDPKQMTTLRSGAEALGKTFAWDGITRDTIAFYQSCL